MQAMVSVLFALDPLSAGLWSCTDPSDAECLARHDRRLSPCSLGRAEGAGPRWRYVAPGWSVPGSFQLACAWRGAARALPLGAHLAGAVMGVCLFAWLCSGSSRRRLLLWGAVTAGGAGVLSANAPGAVAYAALRCAVGLGSGLALPAATALALDV